ncbi:alpha-L-arabinofuranosidase [Mucilaginibacter sp. PPCGB 2223]|uniref:alpha-L-arabinofuranosidase n=1 Tax=Mucilaginibacter sp. PPCGB 2223 TaxID=1886027 RepID=UPI000826CD22|nr:alpha-L-arabinofuranosidase [Mucilaginibacter sp. PPCGB 2223]OCX54410.1 alpha-L-arabinofuranosidase [Mucilaginibacter sp. PPCGB 2223]
MNKIAMGLMFAISFVAIQACKKNGSSSMPTDTVTNRNPVITAPNIPVTAKTQGFFLDDWQPKTFTVPASTTIPSAPSAAAGVIVTVDVSQVLTKVSKYLFGNNTNPYMGQYVTEPVLMDYLTKLSPNILRFPGGSLSDVYFWNSATQKPADVPDSLFDSNGKLSKNQYWFGQDNSSWTFSLDNYYKVLQQTNSTGSICVNYGYARYGTGAHPDQIAAHLAADWVRYDKGRTKFWEIGNENYGNWEAGYKIDTKKNKDGQPQIMTGDLCGRHFKVFADSMRKAAAEVGATIKIGGTLYEAATSYDATQSAWDAGFLAQAGSTADYFIVHNYYTPYQDNSSVDVILNTAITNTRSVMDYMNTLAQTPGVGSKPIALTEWNINAEGSMQKVSNIAGIHAVMVLGELLKNKYGMASRWDLANGWSNGNDHGLFNIGDEPGASKWNARPAFYYMYYFQKFFGDQMVSSSVQGSSDVLSYASSFSSGQAGVVLVNKSSTDHIVSVNIKNYAAGSNFYYYTLTGGSDGTFSRKVLVNGSGPSGVSGGPANYDTLPVNMGSVQSGIVVDVPPRGVVFLVADRR